MPVGLQCMSVIIPCTASLICRCSLITLYNEDKVAVVSIADHSHFYVPLWREAVKKFGAVDGIQHYVRAVMQQGYSILVFPGGGREVLKRQGERVSTDLEAALRLFKAGAGLTMILSLLPLSVGMRSMRLALMPIR